MRTASKLVALFLLLFVWTVGCGGDYKVKAAEHYTKGVAFLEAEEYNAAIIEFRNSIQLDAGIGKVDHSLAKAYMKVGKIASAEKAFKRAIKFDPALSSDIDIELAKISLAKNDIDSAYAATKDLIERSPEDIDTLKLAASVHAAKRDKDKAKEYYQKVLALDANDIDAHVGLAAIYLTEGDTKKTEKEIAIVLDLDSESVRARYIKAELLVKNKKYDDAIAVYKEIVEIDNEQHYALKRIVHILISLDRYDDAVVTAGKIIAKNANDADGYYLKGLAQMRKGSKANLDDAKINFEMATSKNNGHFWAHYFLGVVLYKDGSFERAITSFQMVKNISPKFSLVHLPLAILYLQKKLPDDAIDEARKAIKHSPDNAMAYNVLGTAYMMKRDLDKGLASLQKAMELDPKLADTYAKLGGFYMGTGKPKDAIKEYNSALKIDPKLLNVRILLGMAHLKQKEFDKAVKVFDAGLKHEEDNVVLMNLIGSVYLAKKDHKEARKHYKKAIEINDKFVAPHFNLALISLLEKDNDGALKEYRNILKKDPENLKALIAAGELLEKAGDFGAAEKSYEKALSLKHPLAYTSLIRLYFTNDKKDKAVDIAKQAVKLNPKSSLAVKLLVDTYFSIGDAKSAVKTLEEAKVTNPISVYSYNRLGAYYTKAGEADKAISEFKESLNIESRQPDTLGALSILLLRIDDLDQADEYAGKLIRLKPEYSASYIPQATIQREKGQLDAALKTLIMATSKEPSNLSVRMMLGDLYLAKKNYKKALKVYKKIESEKPDAWNIYMKQGVLYQEMGEMTLATKSYEKALSLSPDNPAVLNNLAWAMAEQGTDLDTALIYAKKALEKANEHPGIIDTLGWVLYKRGDYAGALARFAKASELIPDNPTIRYHHALGLIKTGDKEKARDELEAALGVDSSFPEKKDAERLLSTIR